MGLKQELSEISKNSATKYFQTLNHKWEYCLLMYLSSERHSLQKVIAKEVVPRVSWMVGGHKTPKKERKKERKTGTHFIYHGFVMSIPELHAG